MSYSSRKNLEKLLQSAAERQRQLSMGIANSSKSTPLPAQQTAEIPVLARGVKAAGGAAVVLGLAALIFGFHFSGGVGLLGIFVVLAIIDVWIEPRLRTWHRIAISSFIMLMAVLFTFWIVLVPAPLDARAFAISGDYASGTKIGGIEWNPAFVDLRIIIENASEQDYDDLDVYIHSNEMTAAIGQVSTVPNCSLTLVSDVADLHATTTTPKGEKIQQPFSRMGSDGPYRIRCAKLPNRMPLQLTVAVVNLDWWKKNQPPPASFYGPKRKPTKLEIWGHYKSLAGKPGSLKRILDVEDSQ